MNGKLTVVAMVSGIIISFAINAAALESMKFDNEAKKLDFIRQTLKKEKIVVPDNDPKYCATMMKDFLAGKNFKAIEPDVRADSADDPRLAKWKHCDGKFPVDKDNFSNLDLFGTPPYRYYKIGLYGSRKKAADMMYANASDSGEMSSGYTWVDLKKCRYIAGFPTAGQTVRVVTKKPEAVILNALVYYKGSLWVVDYSEGALLHLMRHTSIDRIQTCTWSLFELSNK